MYPMLEMSCGKCKCVDEVVYIYNKSHPESNHNSTSKKFIQRANAKKIKNLPKYKCIF